MKEDYIQVKIEDINEDKKDIVIAILVDAGFEGFDDTGNTLKAYIGKYDYAEGNMKKIAERFDLVYQRENSIVAKLEFSMGK